MLFLLRNIIDGYMIFFLEISQFLKLENHIFFITEAMKSVA